MAKKKTLKSVMKELTARGYKVEQEDDLALVISEGVDFNRLVSLTYLSEDSYLLGGAEEVVTLEDLVSKVVNRFCTEFHDGRNRYSVRYEEDDRLCGFTYNESGHHALDFYTYVLHMNVTIHLDHECK